MTDSNNPLFGDFLELDLLGSTPDTNNDLFSYFFSEDMNSSTGASAIDLASLGSFESLESIDTSISQASSESATTATSISPLDANVQIKQEQHDIQVLIAHNLQQQEQLRQQQQLLEEQRQKLQPQSSIKAASEPCGSPLLTLVNSPSTTTIVPDVVGAIASIATTTTTASSSPPTAAATPIDTSSISSAATATAQIAVLIDSSKAAAAKSSTSTKRPSPEPTSPARKQAKTERASSPKKTERASSPKKTTPKTAAAPESEPTLATLTSPANTTLSAETLQFLLQQQMQAPMVSHLFTGKLTREEIEDTLARLLESTKHLIAPPPESETIKEEDASDEEMEDAENGEELQEGKTHGLKTQPGIKTDDIPSSTDLKKMTSKERRQLRNKISARNFRVRRKEYIGTLEGQVEQHKTEARHLREAVTYVQEENKRLKEELESMKLQLAQSTIANASANTSTPQMTESTAVLSSENQSLLASILTRSALNANGKSNLTLSMPARPQSPILTPNYHKDVPNSSSLSGSSWKDKNPVFVHTTLVPELRFGDQFQFGPKASYSKDDDMWDRPWLNVERTPKELKLEERNPLLMQGVMYELMQTFLGASMDLFKLSEDQGRLATIHKDTPATVQDYEGDKRIGEALEWEMQQDLWAQVEAQKVLSSQRHAETPIDLSGDVEGDTGLAQLLFSLNLGSSESSSSLEDANMTEWLYESMMARLVDLDLQSSQDKQTFLPFSEVHFA